jgi:hypothetical protein
MQRLVFEYSPAFIFACLLSGVAYAYVLYHNKHHWSKRVNQILFGLRALLVAIIAFLLLGPILKLTHNLFEKPAFVFLMDDSQSLREVKDSTQLQKIINNVRQQEQKLKDQEYEISLRGLSETPFSFFRNASSDLSGAIRSVVAEYEGKNLAGIVLVSDGIYNSGTSPLYLPLRVPVYAIGIGDTTERVDLSLKNTAYNKIVYQGNKFPVRAEVLVKGLPNENVTLSLLQNGKLITKQTQNSGSKSLLQFDFTPEAMDKGIQRLDVAIEIHNKEVNTKNNHSSIFVEVVSGRKKILVIAPAPHPDIKALRAVIEKNPNYEFLLHIQSVNEESLQLQPVDVDLVIFQQAIDENGKTAALYAKFNQSTTPVLSMLTSKSSLRQLAANGIPLTFENVGQTDEIMPVINDQFRAFGLSENVNSIFAKYPPVSVPFGKLNYPPAAQVLLWQRIGNVTTNRPLMIIWEDANKKSAALIGEGIWRWRLNEYDDHASTGSFDEVFGKLIQYLSTKDDKRKFKSFPLQNEFTDSESVVFESQVFNDLFEPIYGTKVNLEILDDQRKSMSFSYVTSLGNQRYRLSAMKEGVYKYKATTELNGKVEEVRGEFLVRQLDIESQNLTADFGLLRKLADETDGRFYQEDQMDQLSVGIEKAEVKSIIHSEDTYESIINLKIVFFLLLFLVSVEWFTRKSLGAY